MKLVQSRVSASPEQWHRHPLHGLALVQQWAKFNLKLELRLALLIISGIVLFFVEVGQGGALGWLRASLIIYGSYE
jgi:hypothetical protein